MGMTNLYPEEEMSCPEKIKRKGSDLKRVNFPQKLNYENFFNADALF
jgi:hypothetical protein